MGILAKVKNMEVKFKSTQNDIEKTKILNELREFSMVEQGLEDVSTADKNEIWKQAFSGEPEKTCFSEIVMNVGEIGRKYKEEGVV